MIVMRVVFVVKCLRLFDSRKKSLKKSKSHLNSYLLLPTICFKTEVFSCIPNLKKKKQDFVTWRLGYIIGGKRPYRHRDLNINTIIAYHEIL